MSAGGFSFSGATPSAGGAAGGCGFAFNTAAKPTPALNLGGSLGATSTPAASGFNLGVAATPSMTFGTPKTAMVAPTPGLSLGTPAAGLTLGGTLGGTSGFSLGGTPAATSLGFTTPGGTQPTTGLTLGTQATTGLTLGGTPAATSSFALGGTQPTPGLTLGGTQPTTGLTLGGTPASTLGGTPAATGLTLGGTPASTGLTFGATPASSTTGLTLGAAATTATTGLTLGATTFASKPGVSFGGLGGTAATTSSGLTLGGLAPTTTHIGSTTANLFGSAASTTVSRGLGGVDPKTTQTDSATGALASDKSGDSRAVKESQVPAEIVNTVEDFKKYVKEQKITREMITHMSSKSRFKVQEEVSTLQQLLSLVSNGLQRNALAIHRLKAESAQELKHAEIAQRTKDTPPGLQYENMAPAEYFGRLVEDFEVRMMTYRQQIEEMESHLASLNQSSMLTPQELSLLLAKLHQSFLALAAQLQIVHEAVKAQKEHFLNYRKVFHGDTSDIFQKRRKVEEKTGSRVVVVTTVGPTPFTGMSNAAAVAMASALNRTQPTAATPAGAGLVLGGAFAGSSSLGQPSLGGTTTSLFGSSARGFGGTSTTQPSAFSGFGSPQTAAVRPVQSLFGTAGNTSGLFGTSPAAGTQTGSLGFPSPSAASAGFNTSTALSPGGFQLAKPPAGNKRGKR